MNQFAQRRAAHTVPPDAHGAAAYDIRTAAMIREAREAGDPVASTPFDAPAFRLDTRGGTYTVADLQARIRREDAR